MALYTQYVGQNHELSHIFNGTSSTFGFTQYTQAQFISHDIVQATCVQCHWSSVGSLSSFTKSYHVMVFDISFFRSGCVYVIQVSIIHTLIFFPFEVVFSFMFCSYFQILYFFIHHSFSVSSHTNSPFSCKGKGWDRGISHIFNSSGFTTSIHSRLFGISHVSTFSNISFLKRLSFEIFNS
jgi:hypothetical protein